MAQRSAHEQPATVRRLLLLVAYVVVATLVLYVVLRLAVGFMLDRIGDT